MVSSLVLIYFSRTWLAQTMKTNRITFQYFDPQMLLTDPISFSCCLYLWYWAICIIVIISCPVCDVIFKINEALLHFKPPPWTEHLNTSGITSHGTDSFHVKSITPGHPIPKISTHLSIFRGGTWKTEFVKTIHSQERTSSEKKSDGLHKKCSIDLWTILLFQLLLCCHTAARCMERT